MSNNDDEVTNLLLAVLAFFLPPLVVAIRVGLGNIHFWLNLGLTLLAWIPGVIHAIYCVFRFKS